MESGEGRAGLELRISLDHRLQRFLVAAVAAIVVGMVAADAGRHSAAAASARSASVPRPRTRSDLRSASLSSRPSSLGAFARRRGGSGRRSRRAGRRNRPSCGGGVGAHAGEGAGLAVPAAIGILGGLDLVGAHALEIIVAGVELADMVEAQPAPVARPVEARAAAGRARGTRRRPRSRDARKAAARLRPVRETASAFCPRSPTHSLSLPNRLYRRDDRTLSPAESPPKSSNGCAPPSLRHISP